VTRVRLVTTWDSACGIAEYAAYLTEAVLLADPTLEIQIETNLHPQAVLDSVRRRDSEVLHLNYHAALHSQWRPEDVKRAKRDGWRVIVTWHDSGVPNSDACRAMYAVADAFVVHEPCDDLPNAHAWPQGVPDRARPYHFGIAGPDDPDGFCFKTYAEQPVVGSVGFPFPWKNFDLLAEASAEAGWALVLVAPGATAEQRERWRTTNPASEIISRFVPREVLGSVLAGCDATAFLHACANTGTSGAIRQGLAARKPVLASVPAACRQFRDLYEDPVGRRAVTWLPRLDVETVAEALESTPIGTIDPLIVRLAARNSWQQLGRRYAALYSGR
jgi:glycosyltransferase involved in cell wall biosynthesis